MWKAVWTTKGDLNMRVKKHLWLCEWAEDIDGPEKRGLCKKSAITAAKKLQYKILRTMDNDEFVAVSSLGLTSAIAVELLLQKMETLGLPKDIYCLVPFWYATQLFYNFRCSLSCKINLINQSVIHRELKLQLTDSLVKNLKI